LQIFFIFENERGETMRKKITFSEAVFMGVGMTIGAGVITMTGQAIGITGSGVFLAYMLAGICMFIGRYPVVILSSTIPMTSGSYVYSKMLRPELGAFQAWVFFIGRVTLAFLGYAFGAYLASITGIDARLSGIIIITIMFIPNWFGLKNAAKLQKIMTYVLITALMSFVAFGIGKVNYNQIFDSTNIFYGGTVGLYKAIAYLFFGIGGAYVLLEYGKDIEEAQKNLPKSLIIVTLIACFLYALVALVASGVLPLDRVAGQPLTWVAEIIYPNRGLFLFFVVGGALLACMTTINASFSWYYNSILIAARDGWFPKCFTYLNKYGVPYVQMIIYWLMGVVPLILGVNIGTLTALAGGLTTASLLFPNFGAFMLPKLYPEEWKASKHYMATAKLYTITLLTTLFFAFWVVMSFVNTNTTVLAYVGIGIAFSIIYILCVRQKVLTKVDNKTNIDEFSPSDASAGSVKE
jgi:amino acid transporter